MCAYVHRLFAPAFRDVTLIGLFDVIISHECACVSVISSSLCLMLLYTHTERKVGAGEGDDVMISKLDTTQNERNDSARLTL